MEYTNRIPYRQRTLARISFFLSIAGAIGLYAFLPDAFADENTEDAIENLEDRSKEIDAKIKAYRQIIELKKKQGATLSDQIIVLDAQASKVELEIRDNKEQIFALENNLRKIELGIEEKRKFIDREKRLLAEFIREYHDGISDGAHVLFAYETENPAVFLNRDEWFSDAGERIREILHGLETTKTDLEKEQKEAETKKVEADTLQTQLDERNTQLETSKENKEGLLAKTHSEQRQYVSLVKTLEQEREEIESEIEDLEAGKIDLIDLGNIPSFKKGLFSYPLQKISISQGYGKTKFAKRAYKSGKHNGIDFSAPFGTTVYAPMGGKVIGIGNTGKYAYGKWIAIDHGNGLVTLYGHLSSQSVKKGEHVDTGEKIGKVGSTGFSTGPHLHFTVFSKKSYEVVESKVKKNIYIPIGATVNPSNYLP